MMKCPECQFENSERILFDRKCAVKLELIFRPEFVYTWGTKVKISEIEKIKMANG
jgi:hypothetical protein